MLAWRITLPLLKRLLPIAALAKLMWKHSRTNPQAGRADTIIALTAQLDRAWRTKPNDHCFERSLIAYRFLSAAGADPRLYFGFQQRKGSTLDGHAWIVVDSLPLYETTESISRYTAVVTFGAHGAAEPVAQPSLVGEDSLAR
jgi:Transglutaminase-like superfamily